MILLNPDTNITNIPPSLQNDLKLILKDNNTWKLVAIKFNAKFKIINQQDIRRIENHSQPSEQFVQLLASRGCSVGLLCLVLREMKFYKALSVLVEPEPVKIVQQPGNDDEIKQIFKGNELQLECQAVGLPPPSYIWFHGNEELLDQTTSKLTIHDFSEQYEGEYYCCAYQEIDGELHKVNSNLINVELHSFPPIITHHPEKECVFRVGESLTLFCAASGHPEPQYEWYKGNCLIPGEETNVLNIRDVKEQHAGFYRCNVKNKAGDCLSNKCKVSIVPEEDFMGLETPRRIIANGKVALLIGNDTYCNFVPPLKTPRKDVATIAEILRKMSFNVIALHNLTLHEMRNAVHTFCSLLSEGSYAFFHYAGHGFEIQGKFMLPIDAPGAMEYLRRDSLCEQEVMQAINEKKPKLIFMLFDMCLKIPDKKDNPKIHNEIAETYDFEPLRNQITQYTTTSNLSAYEKGENSIYVSHLKEHLSKDLPIKNILDIIKKASAKDKQIPCYISNVVDEFYLTDESEENERTRREFLKITSLPKIGPTFQFKNSGFQAAVRFEPHKRCFLNSLDVIVSGLGDWNIEIQLSITPVPEGSKVSETVDASGKCTLKYEELKRSLGLHIIKLPSNDLVITIHNLQRVKIPLLLSLFLKDSWNKTVDSALLELGHPLIAQAGMWYNPKDNSKREGIKCESQHENK